MFYMPVDGSQSNDIGLKNSKGWYLETMLSTDRTLKW